MVLVSFSNFVLKKDKQLLNDHQLLKSPFTG